MLIQCSICKRIRKFGEWIEVSKEFADRPLNIPVKYLLCDDCKGVDGGCERLRKLERKFNIWDEIVAVMVVCTALGIIVAGIIFLQKWANS